MGDFESDDWYIRLCPEGKYLFQLIVKYHKYFEHQDKKYRGFVRWLKIFLLFLTMSSTIVLGLKTVICIDLQILLGLIISAVLSFLSAIAAYFNFEKYWMRNITIHIRFNIMRDKFIFDVESNKIDEAKLEEYRKELEDIQLKNIEYWEKTINKI